MSRAAILVLTFALLAGAEAARASCAPAYTEDRIVRADGAFVGELKSRRRGVFRFRVERVFKGDIGRSIEVRDQNPGTSVALQPDLGDRLASMVMRGQDGFLTNDCQKTSEEALLDATGPECRERGAPPRSYRRDRRGARVVGCGRAGTLPFTVIGSRARRLCLEVHFGRTLPCVDNRTNGTIEISRRVVVPGGSVLVGTATAFVDAVRVEYDLNGMHVSTAAAIVHVSTRRRPRVRRPFGLYVAELPEGATSPKVTALSPLGLGL